MTDSKFRAVLTIYDVDHTVKIIDIRFDGLNDPKTHLSVNLNTNNRHRINDKAFIDTLINLRACYEYLGNIVVFSNFYTSGWFEIEITEGSGTLTVTLVNMDYLSFRSGYLEYTIGIKGGSEFNFMPIIIGVVVIIVIGTVIGLSIHAINKKKQREKEFDDLLKERNDLLKEKNTEK